MDRIVEILSSLSAILSPSGMTDLAIRHLEKMASSAGIPTRLTNKGGLLAGSLDDADLVVSGHVDTLGAMVSGINVDGTLAFSRIGGVILPSFEAEYVTVLGAGGKTWRGTLLLNNPAAHMNREAGSTERKQENMHIRLDAEVSKKEEAEALGVSTGDFVCFDPRFEYTDTGFVKSRFLDDKAGCAAMMDALLSLGPGGVTKARTCFFFTNFEEVGHGASAGIPRSCTRMLVTDMGVIGEKASGVETAVSICVKDANGPYDLGMRRELTALAEKNRIPYRLDVFPFYGSDGQSALAAGNDIRVALIGPGVSASHGMERTHLKGLAATRDLILAYVKAVG
jgi:putative aminopeptidase FrvX